MQKKKRRGRKQLWVLSLADEMPEPGKLPPFRVAPTKLIHFWLPRRFLYPEVHGVDVCGFVDDLNDKIVRRGFVLYDRQVLSTPITGVTVDPGIIRTKVSRTHMSRQLFWQSLRIGERMEIDFELNAGSDKDVYQAPVRQDWGQAQQAFFGFENPYQMAEGPDAFTYSHLTMRIAEPYLSTSEEIAALVFGVEEQHYFTCDCHSHDVVYTTRNRVVCMGCGATHIVLRDGLPAPAGPRLSAAEWFELFDLDGSRVEEELDMAILNIRDLEQAPKIWVTDRWEQAIRRFALFARSPPEEIAAAIHGTEADPALLARMGFGMVETPPPAVDQVACDSVDVDLIENAAHALRAAVPLYLAARADSARLVNAIPQLFRAIELTLKQRLIDLDPKGLAGTPNNPAVLKRLGELKVKLAAVDRQAIDDVRRLRNQLQHGTATFNQRHGLSICRRALVFLDRFMRQELTHWIGDELPPEDWGPLLRIPEIKATAESVLAERLTDVVKNKSEWTVMPCERCQQDAVPISIMNIPVCVLCGHIPPYHEIPEPPKKRRAKKKTRRRRK